MNLKGTVAVIVTVAVPMIDKIETPYMHMHMLAMRSLSLGFHLGFLRLSRRGKTGFMYAYIQNLTCRKEREKHEIDSTSINLLPWLP